MKHFALATLALLAVRASAMPLVSYTVSGTSGDYTLDFTIVNNMVGTDEEIYSFAVHDVVPIAADPYGWVYDDHTLYDYIANGGSNRQYYVNGGNDHGPQFFPGMTLSGFKAHSTALTAPTSVYFAIEAYAETTFYYGGDNLNTEKQPFFEGVAYQAVPEPMTVAALGFGVVGLVTRRRRK